MPDRQALEQGQKFFGGGVILCPAKRVMRFGIWGCILPSKGPGPSAPGFELPTTGHSSSLRESSTATFSQRRIRSVSPKVIEKKSAIGGCGERGGRTEADLDNFSMPPMAASQWEQPEANSAGRRISKRRSY